MFIAITNLIGMSCAHLPNPIGIIDMYLQRVRAAEIWPDQLAFVAAA